MAWKHVHDAFKKSTISPGRESSFDAAKEDIMVARMKVVVKRKLFLAFGKLYLASSKISILSTKFFHMTGFHLPHHNFRLQTSATLKNTLLAFLAFLAFISCILLLLLK